MARNQSSSDAGSRARGARRLHQPRVQDRQGWSSHGLVALVVVGDGKGNVGVGMGKSAEVPMAIYKASRTPRRTCSTCR